MYYTGRVTFIEQPVFTRMLLELVDDDVQRIKAAFGETN